MKNPHKPGQANSQLSDAAAQLLSDLKAEVNPDGTRKYGPLIDKKQYATIVGCSLSAISNYISHGYGLPNYRKIGTAKNAKVLFSLRDVAEYLSSITVKTA